jgi:predicted GIY-YIG superfamily endonuclease
MPVYLLHFSDKYHHAKHYIGACHNGNLKKRIHAHNTNSNVALLKAARQVGITFALGNVWHSESWEFEKKLKARKNSKQLCKICRGKS